MAEREKPQPSQKPRPGTDDRDKTLTEKNEEKAGDRNPKPPGPIYDV